MQTSFKTAVVLSLVTMPFMAPSATASVGLLFTNGTSAFNSANVSPGGIFGFSVKMSESSVNDKVSGVDYQIQASTSGVFEFLSRNSQVSGSSFTFANGKSDAQLTSTILSPTNGTDLGTSTSTGAAATGPGTYQISDFSFEVLPTAPKGVYTLSFAATHTAGPAPVYATGNFNTLGTYTVFVPGPVPLGDANYDGKIDGSDYSLIDNGFVNHLSGWTNGDFNLDGVINGSDYTLMDNAFNTQAGATASIAAELAPTSVPEPSILLTSISSFLLLGNTRASNRRKASRLTS